MQDGRRYLLELPKLLLLLLCMAVFLPAVAGPDDIVGPDPDWFVHGWDASTAGDVNGDGFSDVLVTSSGGVELFLGSAGGLDTISIWAAQGGNPSVAGDVNDDGFDDVILVSGGRAELYLGSNRVRPLSLSPDWSSDVATTVGQVATAGDVDGDGTPEVLIGTSVFKYTGSGLSVFSTSGAGSDASTVGDVNGDGFDDIGIGNGVYYSIGGVGFASTPDWSFTPEYSGRSGVRLAGDVNGDGFADVLGFDSGSFVRLYYGSADGLSTDYSWLEWSVWEGDAFTAGDFNGDGFADIVVGGFDANSVDNNKVRVFLGAFAGPSSLPVVTFQSLIGFGNRVSTAGDVNGDGFSDILFEGANFVYVFHGSVTVETELSTLWDTITLATEADIAAHAGDVNGDGINDVLEYRLFAGEIRLYLGVGPGAASPPTAAWTVLAGTRPTAAGDVDGDGYDDVLIGDPDFNSGEGATYLYLGSPASPYLGAAPDWQATGAQAGARFGEAVAGAGDLNGDGYADVIVGAPAYDNGQVDEGRVSVYLGSAQAPYLSVLPEWTNEGNQAGAGFGGSVAAAGDVNADGFGDVIVGAPKFDNGETDEGMAFVYLGADSRPPLTGRPVWSTEADAEDSFLGNSVASAGDVNGDGFGDIIIGAPGIEDFRVNDNITTISSALVFLGSPAGPAVDPAWSDHKRGAFGWSVAGAGDMNDDGLSDVVVGAPSLTVGDIPENHGGGGYYVYTGSSVGAPLSGQPAWLKMGSIGDGIGASVDAAGDTDGDGFGEIVVAGAKGISVVDGSTSDVHPPLRPRQLRGASGDTPVSIDGVLGIDNEFRITARGRTPTGQGHVGLEWQVEPARGGVLPFASAALHRSTEFCSTLNPQGDSCSAVTGAAGAVEIKELIGNSLPATPYRWRVRVVTGSPFFPQSPWMSLPVDDPTGATLRSFGVAPAPSLEPRGPAPNQVVTTTSDPLTHTWNRAGMESFRIEWSRNPGFEAPLVTTEQLTADAAGIQVFTPSRELWDRILPLGQSLDFREASIFWRVIGTSASGEETISDFQRILVARSQSPLISMPLEGQLLFSDVPPTLIWDPRQGTRFQVRFSANSHLGPDSRVIAGENYDITTSQWPVPAATWSDVVALSNENTDGTIYFAVFSKDALGGDAWSAVRAVRILQPGTRSPEGARVPRAYRSKGRRWHLPPR